MTNPLYLLLALVALAIAVVSLSEYVKDLDRRATQAREVTAADALLAHGVPRDKVVLHVLGRAFWSEQNTATVLRETGGDATVAGHVLNGITHALMFDHILFPRQRVEMDGMVAWTRAAMLLLDGGVSRKNLAKTVQDAINAYDVALPLRYTAWAYAAGMGREEATARWRTAQINMDGVRRIARDRGADLSQPHAIATAAA